MDIIELFNKTCENLELYAELVNKIAKMNYDNLNDLTKKILFLPNSKIKNKYFWDILTTYNNIEEIQDFVKNVYNIYLKCPANEYSNNLKPLDKNTNEPIEYTQIYKDETTGFCYNKSTYIKTIIIDGNTSNISPNMLADASLNIANEIIYDNNLTTEEKKEELIQLTENIGKKARFKFTWQKGALLFGFLAILAGILIYNTNFLPEKFIELYNSSETTIERKKILDIYKQIIFYGKNPKSINPEDFIADLRDLKYIFHKLQILFHPDKFKNANYEYISHDINVITDMIKRINNYK